VIPEKAAPSQQVQLTTEKIAPLIENTALPLIQNAAPATHRVKNAASEQAIPIIN
jgi:hypothetical protein